MTASAPNTTTCAFTDVEPIHPEYADPEGGCQPMSVSSVVLAADCPIDGHMDRCSGHPTCVPHLKQFLEEGRVEQEIVDGADS
ncbi:hypothetical protein [Geodermatophilus sabuli]|uniref:Uncharacterized protein n=1 Tax=Geodermatophilus sabuli TaxID=1564158 RepID=A0A285E6T1_9ACTN|nr:hypothetical protein [Geodermatophilus sabuli]MBB3082310.1 hypothetical protein [Geodermatophilus sabuli]SNX94818.1 hypothetical protein SAMN06893097_101615 [Geodermatophilus sabuli]